MCLCVTKHTRACSTVTKSNFMNSQANQPHFPFFSRHGDHRSVGGRAGQRHGRPGRVSGSRAAVLPDPSHGEDGPAGRHVEAPRLSCLRAQTGKCGFRIHAYANGRLRFCFLVFVVVVAAGFIVRKTGFLWILMDM